MRIEHLASGEWDEGCAQTSILTGPMLCRREGECASDDDEFNALVAGQSASMQRRLMFLFAVHRALAEITHDLKTPVRVIGIHTQLLQRHLASSASADAVQIEQGLAQIATTAARMSALLDDLQSLARGQSRERIPPRYQPVDLVALVGQVVADHQLLTNRHQIRIDAASLPRAVLPGRWDVPHLERALGNLVANAIKYSPDGGEIVVEIECERQAGGPVADKAILRIHDQGVGIPETDLAAIFELFHRATNVSGRIPGLGIGLTNAQQIIAQHGGSIWIASELDQGTTVTIHLPLFPPECVCDSGNTSALGHVLLTRCTTVISSRCR